MPALTTLWLQYITGSPLQIQPKRFIVNKPVSPLEQQPLSPHPHNNTQTSRPATSE